jgi:hypothetical protein
LKGEQTEVSGQMYTIGDHETATVIDYGAPDPAVVLTQADLDTSCSGVLLYIGQRF